MTKEECSKLIEQTNLIMAGFCIQEVEANLEVNNEHSALSFEEITVAVRIE